MVELSWTGLVIGFFIGGGLGAAIVFAVGREKFDIVIFLAIFLGLLSAIVLGDPSLITLLIGFVFGVLITRPLLEASL